MSDAASSGDAQVEVPSVHGEASAAHAAPATAPTGVGAQVSVNVDTGTPAPAPAPAPAVATAPSTLPPVKGHGGLLLPKGRLTLAPLGGGIGAAAAPSALPPLAHAPLSASQGEPSSLQPVADLDARRRNDPLLVAARRASTASAASEDGSLPATRVNASSALPPIGGATASAGVAPAQADADAPTTSAQGPSNGTAGAPEAAHDEQDYRPTAEEQAAMDAACADDDYATEEAHRATAQLAASTAHGHDSTTAQRLAQDGVFRDDEHYHDGRAPQPANTEGEGGIGETKAGGGGNWAQLVDEEGHMYYYNYDDGTSSWERPDGFVATSEEAPKPSLVDIDGMYDGTAFTGAKPTQEDWQNDPEYAQWVEWQRYVAHVVGNAFVRSLTTSVHRMARCRYDQEYGYGEYNDYYAGTNDWGKFESNADVGQQAQSPMPSPTKRVAPAPPEAPTGVPGNPAESRRVLGRARTFRNVHHVDEENLEGDDWLDTPWVAPSVAKAYKHRSRYVYRGGQASVPFTSIDEISSVVG